MSWPCSTHCPYPISEIGRPGVPAAQVRRRPAPLRNRRPRHKSQGFARGLRLIEILRGRSAANRAWQNWPPRGRNRTTQRPPRRAPGQAPRACGRCPAAISPNASGRRNSPGTRFARAWPRWPRPTNAMSGRTSATLRRNDPPLPAAPRSLPGEHDQGRGPLASCTRR